MSEHVTIQRNRGAWQIESLIQEYYSTVYRLCLSILSDPDDADDAAQETFIAAHQARESYRGDSSLRTWLTSIAVNTCRGYLRKRKARKVLSDTLKLISAVFSHTNKPEGAAIQNEANRQLWRVVDSLDEKHRLPLILYYAQAMSVAEIGAILGLKEDTVHSRLYFARRKLAGCLHRCSLTSEDDFREEAS